MSTMSFVSRALFKHLLTNKHQNIIRLGCPIMINSINHDNHLNFQILKIYTTITLLIKTLCNNTEYCHSWQESEILEKMTHIRNGTILTHEDYYVALWRVSPSQIIFTGKLLLFFLLLDILQHHNWWLGDIEKKIDSLYSHFPWFLFLTSLRKSQNISINSPIVSYIGRSWFNK